MKKVLSQWYTEYRCKNCKHIISTSEKYRGDGRCPYCAYKSSVSYTVMEVTERAYRLVWHNDCWWKFLIKPEREYQIAKGEKLNCGTCNFEFVFDGENGGCPSCGNGAWTQDKIPLY